MNSALSFKRNREEAAHQPYIGDSVGSEGWAEPEGPPDTLDGLVGPALSDDLADGEAHSDGINDREGVLGAD